jgi:hypothetical protein
MVSALSLLSSHAAFAASDDVEFYATASPNQVSFGDTVSWQIVLATGQDKRSNAKIDLPVMADFDIVGKSSSSQTHAVIGPSGFQVTNQTILNVTLMPKHVGSLTISPAKVDVAGTTYSTQPVIVKVLPPGSTPKPKAQAQHQPDPDPFQQFFGGNDPFGNMPGGNPGVDPFEQMMGEGGPPKDSDLFVRASLDKKQAYLGEQVTLSIYLFARVDVSGIENFKLPKLDAFWAEDIESPQQITGDVKTVNGVPYRMYLLKRRALFPLKAGKQTVDPVEVDVTTGLSIFGNGHKSHRISQTSEINVLPLPAGAPAGFDATNVGQWKVSAATNPLTQGPVQTTVGQPVTLDLTIEGAGNFKNLALPKLPVVHGLKFFDPTTTDKVNVAKGRFGGRRTLEYLVSPEQTGTFDIPPISFSYFNPATASYETSRTDPIQISVTAGNAVVAATGAGSVASATMSNPQAGANQLAPGLLRPLHFRGDLKAVGEPLSQRTYFGPLLLLPFGLYFLGAAFGKMREMAGRDDPNRRRRTAQGRARKRFKGAMALLESGDSGAYYGQVAKALNDYLTDKLGIAAAGLTRDDLSRYLRNAGADEQSVGSLLSALESCDLGRFAPGASDARRKVLEDAAAAVETLESQKLKRNASGASSEARA